MSEEALNFLETLPAPIAVVTVAGMYRTGKSYLLNRVILNRQRGFSVGPSVNPCTKGLWVWHSTLSAVTADEDPCQIIVIDSEGLGALDEDADHDARVFSLALLLASTFIYNSVGAIDETALESLSLVVNLTKHIHIKSQETEEADEQDYAAFFPAFYWVVRDFSLQLISPSGDKINPKEYLELALMEQKGFTEAIDDKNRIRRLLRGFFPERDCFTLVRPTASEEQLQTLEDKELSDLRPEFQTQVYKLREKVLTKVKPKAINGKLLNGMMLANLLRAYVSAINAGAVPSIESAWSYICKHECAKASNDALQMYIAETEGNIIPRMPMMETELKQWHQKAKKTALDTFKEQAVGQDKDTVQETLLGLIQQRYVSLQENNEDLALEHTEDFIRNWYERIDTRLRNGEFQSFLNYEEELTAFQAVFKEHGPQGPKRVQQMLRFCNEKLAETADIFLGNVKNELNVSSQLASERFKALELEHAEVLSQFANLKSVSQSTIRRLESENAELSAVNGNLKYSLEALKGENERVEKEWRDTCKALKQEYNAMVLESSSKVSTLEDRLKEADQKQNLQLSEHIQEVALLQQKTSFLEALLEESSKRENDYLTELTSQKKEHSVNMKDLIGKHDGALLTYQRQLQTESDKTAELEKLLMEQSAKIEIIQAQKDEVETANEGKITELLKQVTNLQKQLENKDKETRLRVIDLLKEQETSQNQLRARLEESDRKNKAFDISFKSEQAKWLRSNALLTQKTEFLEQQLEETKKQFLEAEQRHEAVVKALHSATDTWSQENSEIQIARARDELRTEYQAIITRNEEEKTKLATDLAAMTRNCEKMGVKMKGDVNEWTAKEQSYIDRIETLNTEKGKLLEQVTVAALQRSQNNEGVVGKLKARVQELEQELEDTRVKASQELANINIKTSESLQQLTTAYEGEKTRLMQKIQEEKAKAETEFNRMTEEYELKLREDGTLAEERIQELEIQMQDMGKEIDNERVQFQKQSALNIQKIDTLERHLQETKENMSAFQATHGAAVEQHLSNFQKERGTLQSKCERLATDLSAKDKEVMTVRNALEQLTAELSLKEREVEDVKAELGTERALLQERLEDAKIKGRQISEEAARKKSEYLKEIALARQEIEFQGKRISELVKLKDESEKRYTDTLSSLKEDRVKDTADLVDRLTQEKDILEKKLTQKRKEMKDSEGNYVKQITALEKERAIANEKLSNLEAKIADMEFRYSQEVASSRRSVPDVRDPDSKFAMLQQEVERLQIRIFEAEKELSDKASAYDRDKTLWENKFNFLMAQRDAARTDLGAAQKKFEQSLEEVRKLSIPDKEKSGNSLQVASIEAKFNSQLRELQENSTLKMQESLEKNRNLERELRVAREELELERRERTNASTALTNRIQEMTDSEQRIKTQIQTQTALWEKRVSDDKDGFEKEKTALKAKVSTLEQKITAADQQCSQLHLEAEKERARWAMDRDHLLAQKNELQEKAAQLQKRGESLLKENEKLRADRTVKMRSPLGRKESGMKFGVGLLGSSPSFQEILQSQEVATPGSTATSAMSAKGSSREKGVRSGTRMMSLGSEKVFSPVSRKKADEQ